MSVICIITARGGSKRIPQKNIKEFCGKPIISYSIEAAIESGIFDEIMVSTDNDEIANIAIEYGARVPFRRSEKTSGDHSMTVEVLCEVIDSYKKIGKTFDTICCIYPTAPFINAKKLVEAYKEFCETKASALIPVVKYSFPPQRCFVINEGLLHYKWKENEKKRSQDLEPFYHDAGQFYYINTQIMMATDTLVPEKTVPFILDELEVQDIDNYVDWEIAELKYSRLIGAGV